MSYYSRTEVNANSALLVSITPNDYDFDNNPLSGIAFQRKLESDAFDLGGKNYFAPAQRVGDFLNNIPTTSFNEVIPSYKPGVTPCNLHDMLPKFIASSLQQALIDLGNKMPAFKNENAVLTAIESRSSSPITIERDENYTSSIQGLYPTGEGAGFAGGIVSAAIDGMKVAESIINSIKEKS